MNGFFNLFISCISSSEFPKNIHSKKYNFQKIKYFESNDVLVCEWGWKSEIDYSTFQFQFQQQITEIDSFLPCEWFWQLENQRKRRDGLLYKTYSVWVGFQTNVIHLMLRFMYVIIICLSCHASSIGCWIPSLLWTHLLFDFKALINSLLLWCSPIQIYTLHLLHFLH